MSGDWGVVCVCLKGWYVGGVCGKGMGVGETNKDVPKPNEYIVTTIDYVMSVLLGILGGTVSRTCDLHGAFLFLYTFS